MTGRAIMLQGTQSDVGKSVLAAGLCRVFTRRGYAVRPFKPQNMSNNAAVTADGGEIGRAQALQALACRVSPTTDMNPVLLKPQSDVGAQLVVNGQVRGNYEARAYHDMRATLLDTVLDCFHRLRETADLVVVEGAGGSAEVNLRAGDIANMGFAGPAAVPVVLVGDVERGGVIANIVGTVSLLSPGDRASVVGFIVNKFRGDPSLFAEGLDIIRELTGLSPFGVVPYFEQAGRLPSEDSMALDGRREDKTGAGIRIAVPRLANIANFDDLDPLRVEPSVEVTFVESGQPLPGDADLVILPGTKTSLTALRHFRDQGWDIDLAAHHRRGGHILGLCGGYQMLGRRLADPDGLEGPAGEEAGLGFLDIETRIAGKKTLAAVEGRVEALDARVSGYRMHMGVTRIGAACAPLVTLPVGSDGAISSDGRVAGCYLHGLFASDAFRAAYLARLQPGVRSVVCYAEEVDTTLDSLAEHLEAALDVDGLFEAAA